LAQGFCRYLAKLGPAFGALYIYGSTMKGGAHTNSDVDVIILVHKKTDSIESLLCRLDRLLTQSYRLLVGVYAPERLFDLHLVDEVDVKRRRGYGAVIQSLWTAPVCLWRR
jgi:predicted nucleotidyltransferase